MSNEQLKDLLSKILAEIHNTEIDAETRSLLQELDTDIHKLLDSQVTGTDADTDTILGRVQLLETEFASKYPVAERYLKEIVETLARLGV